MEKSHELVTQQKALYQERECLQNELAQLVQFAKGQRGPDCADEDLGFAIERCEGFVQGFVGKREEEMLILALHGDLGEPDEREFE